MVLSTCNLAILAPQFPIESDITGVTICPSEFLLQSR